MKRIGLIGGMSWESTAQYYRFLNQALRARLGGLHSAELLLRSLDFAPVEAWMRAGRWDAIAELLAAEARALAAGGAELVLLTANTMHKVAPAIEAAIEVPFLHIADPTAEAARAAGCSTIGLLATAYTMEQEFYVGRLSDRHGLEVLVPGADDRRRVHEIIFEELCRGVVDDGSRETYRRVIADLVARGAQGVVLGCTEIGLLVSDADSPVPLYDTARLHAEKAIELALAGESG